MQVFRSSPVFLLPRMDTFPAALRTWKLVCFHSCSTYECSFSDGLLLGRGGGWPVHHNHFQPPSNYTVGNHRPSARGLDLKRVSSHANPKLMGSRYTIWVRATPFLSHGVMTVQKLHVWKQVNLLQMRALSSRNKQRRLTVHSYLKYESTALGWIPS